MGKYSTLFSIIVIVSVLCSCEGHDYWMMGDSLSVDSEQGIFSSSNSGDVSQDLFVRYQLDYELTNQSSERSTDVVVSATSYVNRFERATAYKVWHLDPSETVKGVLMPNQLQIGNSLDVSLLCCTVSMCSNREAICLEHGDEPAPVSVDEIAEFCYDSCEPTESCEKNCPAESVCESYCDFLKEEDLESCRVQMCSELKYLKTCDYVCLNDEDCLAECQPAQECLDRCVSYRASCFMNCLATWNRCEDEVYKPDNVNIPCAICGMEGECVADLKTIKPSPTLTSVDGTEYPCEPECRYYPSVCITECESMYESKTDRMSCQKLCLQQNLFWCNDNFVADDYVDSNGQQPCCFDTYCNNTLSGVVKSYDVACFNDTDCRSGKVCSREGLCESSGSSSCRGIPLRGGNWKVIVWILGMCVCIGRFRRKVESRDVA